MAFSDLTEVFDDTLRLPVGGKWYVIPAPDFELGLWCQTMMTGAIAVVNGQPAPANMPDLDLDDTQEEALYRRLLGSVFDELRDDNVSWPRVQLISQTVMWWITSGLAAAEEFWQNGGNPPKDLAPNRAARRNSTRSTAGANTTRKAASMSGTKRRQT